MRCRALAPLAAASCLLLVAVLPPTASASAGFSFEAVGTVFGLMGLTTGIGCLSNEGVASVTGHAYANGHIALVIAVVAECPFPPVMACEGEATDPGEFSFAGTCPVLDATFSITDLGCSGPGSPVFVFHLFVQGPLPTSQSYSWGDISGLPPATFLGASTSCP
jgi:hypothetical protein